MSQESQEIRQKQLAVKERLREVAEGLGQLVLQGPKRQVQGSNGSNPAQLGLSQGFNPNRSIWT